ncbi:MAG: tetratricopeptide repeat protein [Clostridia bacterium]|nr:tetratricopeptide repeat protein [Clostridia bacterium]
MWPFDRRPPRPVDPEAAFREEVELLVRRGRFADAESRLRAHLAEDPRDAWARNKLGAALALSGQRDEATRVLGELAADEPDYAPAWINLGNMAFERGDIAEAERLYRKALELDPLSSVAHNNLAAVMKRKGDIGAMVSHLKRARRVEVQALRDPRRRRG